MTEVAKQAQEVAEELLQKEENQLYVELGLAAHTVLPEQPSKGGFADLTVTLRAVPTAGDRAQGDWYLEFGRGLFKRMEKTAHQLICGTDDISQQERDDLLAAFGGGKAVVVGALTTILVAYLGLSAAIATFIAVLLVKLFFKPAYEQFCEMWTAALADA